MIGCDKFCSYCVVPNTRGPEQSRPPQDVAREVITLAEQGVKEVTLLGQTVNSYKHLVKGWPGQERSGWPGAHVDASPPGPSLHSDPATHDSSGSKTFRLSDLLESIHDTPGIERIKFVTNYPKDMTSDLLEAIRDLPKVAHYLHVPLQAGCDDVLARMKRGYTTADYAEMMERIHKIVPDCAVSSDFIVGFCGESEESFAKSMEAVRRYRFKNSFIFKYSPRRGTKAFELYEDDVPEDVKKRRNNELLALQNEISEEDNAQFVGRSVEVLVEGPSKWAEKGLTPDAVQSLPGWHDGASQADGSAVDSLSGDTSSQGDSSDGGAVGLGGTQLVGRTKCDRIVVFDGNPRLAGTLADVTIHDCTQTTLIGAIVTREVQHGSKALLPILG